MRTYECRLTGRMPVIHHADNVEWADDLSKWRKDPENKGTSKAGDDRSPAWTWIGYLYQDCDVVTVPSDNLMTCFLEGGALVPTGKGQKTFKAQSQSGMLVFEPHWPLLVGPGGETVATAKIETLLKEADFAKHKEIVKSLGFELFVKRAKIGQAKHVRVRPIFGKWAAVGTIKVWDDQITTEVLSQIVDMAGRYRGLGDWRPGSPRKPGPFGTFDGEVKLIEEG